MSTYALVAVTTPEQWTALHDIRRAVLFAPGRHVVDIVYDDNHPDDHSLDNQPVVLTLDGRFVGTTRLDRRQDGRGVVRLVAIAAAEQRRGHGRQMSALVEAEARRWGIIRLLVNAAPDAVGFYERMGWQHGTWDSAELTGIASDCVQMTKTLA